VGATYLLGPWAHITKYTVPRLVPSMRRGMEIEWETLASVCSVDCAVPNGIPHAQNLWVIRAEPLKMISRLLARFFPRPAQVARLREPG
jgi:hypothetical protein